jgi:hypothetical protein
MSWPWFIVTIGATIGIFLLVYDATTSWERPLPQSDWQRIRGALKRAVARVDDWRDDE